MTLPELEEGDTSEKVFLKSHTMLTISRGCRSASHFAAAIAAHEVFSGCWFCWGLAKHLFI